MSPGRTAQGAAGVTQASGEQGNSHQSIPADHLLVHPATLPPNIPNMAERRHQAKIKASCFPIVDGKTLSTGH